MSDKIFAGQRYIDRDGDVWQRAAYDVNRMDLAMYSNGKVAFSLVDARSHRCPYWGPLYEEVEKCNGPLTETDPDPEMPRPKSKNERIAELEARVAELEGQVAADKQPEPKPPLTERLPVGSVMISEYDSLAFKTSNGVWKYIDHSGRIVVPMTQYNLDLINDPDDTYWTQLNNLDVT